MVPRSRLVDLVEPGFGFSVFQVVVDVVADVGQGAAGDLFGAQQIVAVGLLERFGDLALLEGEDRGAQGVGDAVGEAERVSGYPGRFFIGSQVSNGQGSGDLRSAMRRGQETRAERCALPESPR